MNEIDQLKKDLQKVIENFELFRRHSHNGVDSEQIDNFNVFQSSLEKRTITLTSAQILALNTTPITLVQAIPNSLVIVEGITAKLIFNSIAYTGANNLEFRYTGASGAKVTADMANTFINSAATAYDHAAGVVTELTPVSNAPIVVVVPTANPGAGNSTMTIVVKYRVISF